MIRALLLVAAAAALWGAGVAASGGFDVRLGALSLRSHDPVPAFAVAAVCLLAAFHRGAHAVGDAVAWWWGTVERRAAPAALLVAALTVAFGAMWGTYVAGGPDSYCYVNQAEILARGDVRELQPIVARAPWPDRAAAFVPIGHVPTPGAEGAIVPMCAAGYPLLMAAARLVAGRTAMFWIVPLMGGLAVWLTFLLGRRAAGPLQGLFASLLLATSPTFLYQIVQPMTDVPAAALWTLALLAAIAPGRSGAAQPLAAGVATGAALMVRPNLLPLAAVTAAFASFGRRPVAVRTVATSALWFAAGVLPFVVTIALLQNAMYGGALRSGYGDLGSLFSVDHVLPNLTRYPAWLISTETPFVLLALAAPWVLRRGEPRQHAWRLLAFAAATFACYIPYEVFDAWWYLRFVLPAFPPLLVLSSAVFLALLARVRVGLPLRAVGAMAVAIGVAAFHLSAAASGNAFRMRDLEQRFRDGGEYVARRLPANAAVVTFWQSGSVRFYSGRQTVVWNAIDPRWLDRALEFLRSEGLRPYLLFERDEEQEFRRRFEGHSPLGALDWPPLADISRQVRIYDPSDRERYRRGERIQTERVRTIR